MRHIDLFLFSTEGDAHAVRLANATNRHAQVHDTLIKQ